MYVERKKRNILQRNIVMIVAACYGISYTTIRVVHAHHPGQNFEGVMKIAYIITFTVKLLLDTFAFIIFTFAFRYFLNRKYASLKKEALLFTPKQKILIYVIVFLLIMRVLGSIYTFIVGVLVLNPEIFNNP